jgi:hypothetical protein
MEREDLSMNHLLIALIVFICVFGCASLGMYVRVHLPEHHLSDNSIGVVKLATGLIATMAALVLGLLISSAKGTFDTTNAELLQNATMVIQFDRLLARYGPETGEIRTLIKRSYAATVDIIASGDSAQMAQLNSTDAINRSEALQRKVEDLVPHNESQQIVKAHARQLIEEIFNARSLTLLQANGSIPFALLAMLVAWLSMILGTFGLFASRNGTIIAAMLMCALSTSGAIFLIEELNSPLDGWVGLSVAPMRDTLSRMGQ